MQKHFPIVIHKEPDTDYCVTVPDLPGCITAGDTLDDAQNQALVFCHAKFEGDKDRERQETPASFRPINLPIVLWLVPMACVQTVFGLFVKAYHRQISLLFPN